MKTKRNLTIWISALLLFTLLLSACGSQGVAGPEPTAAEPAGTADEPAIQTTEEVMPSTGENGLPEVDPLALDGNIVIAGSSTVYPLTEVMALRFKDEGFPGEITVDSIGSGAGFERFCEAGETDIANASRAIRDEEIQSCQSIGRDPIEFRVGTDALAIVVNPANDFIDNLTLEELAMIFSNDVTTWSEVNPEWPAEPIQRFSPGTDSGTYDFFIEEVMEPVYGEEAEAKFLDGTGVQLSEDDNVLVQGVTGSPHAIGYFGYAYFQENEDILKDLSVDGVEPTAETAESGDYPLARPLFIYSDAGVMEAKPQVAAFINFFLTYVNEEILEVGYFPASTEALDTASQNWLDAMAQ